MGDGDRKEGISRSCLHIRPVKAKCGLGVFRDEQPKPPLLVTLYYDCVIACLGFFRSIPGILTEVSTGSIVISGYPDPVRHAADSRVIERGRQKNDHWC